jgi:hypothetical protein
MSRPHPNDDLPPPACGPTRAALDEVFDGTRPLADLTADPHLAGCAACRGRLREARVLLAALAVSPAPVTVPSRFAGDVLRAVRAERRERRRRRAVASVGGGLAVAAAVMVAVWAWNRSGSGPVVAEQTPPFAGSDPVPALRPVRVSAELAKAGDALRESSRPLAEPAAAAPKALATLAGAMTPPAVGPVAEDAAPVGASLAELPGAARAGLEPLTGTTQKAFNRLLRDVGVFQASARPKS